MSSTLSELEQELATLEAQAAEIHKIGYLQGVRLEKSPAGGTASLKAKQESRYGRLRAGRGKLLDNGKRSQYIPLSQIDYFEGLIDRGKRLRKIERRLEKLRHQRSHILTQAAQWGLLKANE
ncbi:MAG: hypothetical protein ACTS3T_03070 [Almyronema sp.]